MSLARVCKKKPVAPSPIPASIAAPEMIPAVPAHLFVSCATSSPIPASAASPIMVFSPPSDLDLAFVAPAVAPLVLSLSVVALTFLSEKKQEIV